MAFWFSPSKAGITLTAEKSVNGEWQKVWHYNTDRKRELRQTIDVADADMVRLIVSREEGVTGGYLLIDDVTVY